MKYPGYEEISSGLLQPHVENILTGRRLIQVSFIVFDLNSCFL